MARYMATEDVAEVGLRPQKYTYEGFDLSPEVLRLTGRTEEQQRAYMQAKRDKAYYNTLRLNAERAGNRTLAAQYQAKVDAADQMQRQVNIAVGGTRPAGWTGYDEFESQRSPAGGYGYPNNLGTGGSGYGYPNNLGQPRFDRYGRIIGSSIGGGAGGGGGGGAGGGAGGGLFNGGQFLGGTVEQRDALATIRGFLEQYGLGSLAEWAWNQLIEGRSKNEIMLDLTQQPEYKTRFRAIVEREKLGLSPMSPAEVIAYEQQASQLMRAAGLPPGFYDSFEDFADLMGKKNVSMAELNARIENGYARVANADPLIRQAFASLFGPSGDAALASVFLDADKALPVLEQQASAAEFAGTGLQFGFVVSKDLAMSAARANLPSYRGRTDWQTVAEMRPLFSETISERGDIIPEEGVEAVFGVGANPAGAREQIGRRVAQRVADFAGGGGAELSGAGVKGLGRAGR